MDRFLNKTVMITGGARGIGRSIAERFYSEGANVSIIDTDTAAGTGLFTRMPGLRFTFGDIADEKCLKQFYSDTMEAFSKIDCLINNAGIEAGGLLSGCGAEQFDRVLAVNLRAPYLLTKLAKDQLRANSGSVINIVSTRVFQSEPDTEAYTAAKGGLAALTRAMAVSLGPYVRVNSISPGWIETGGYQNPFSDERIPHTMPDDAQHPAGRVGIPDDIASAAVFLVSDEAKFITGQNLTVDGGMSARMIYSGSHGWTFNI